jgi:hypothetical protein
MQNIVQSRSATLCVQQHNAFFLCPTPSLCHFLAAAESFSEWMQKRPDVQAALEAVQSNPGAALAPLPRPRLPVLLEVCSAFAQVVDSSLIYVLYGFIDGALDCLCP